MKMKTLIPALIPGALLVLLCATAQGQTPEPVLHFSFNNVSGTTVINDGSGGAAMNGTLNGTATIANGGKFDNALLVTGVDSTAGSVRIANSVVPLNILPANAWTVACWIKSTTQGGMWMYQGDGGWANHNTTFGMLVNNGTVGVNGHAAGGVRYAAGWQQGTAIVDDGNWHHVVFVWDGTNKMQYVDGVLDTWVADQWANADGTGGQFYIGGNGNGQGDGQVCLNGLIDEVNVFSNALSQSQVTALYNVQVIPVVATVRPASGIAGGSFKVTATVTPGLGTVTNVSVDLSGIAGSSAANLVLSNANVYTNTFTVPMNATPGAATLIVNATGTQDLVGAGSTPFTVFPNTAPAIVKDTTPTNFFNAYVGQGVTMSAVFSGLEPISYNWQVSVDGGSTFTDIPGATNTTYTIPSLSAADNGTFYQLQASNQVGVAVSTYTYLQVNSGTPTYLWSAPISFAGLTAEQILTNFPAGNKIAGALVAKNLGRPITVTLTNAGSQPIVFAGAGNWAALSGGAGFLAGANTNLTGNSGFNACLNDGYNDNATHTITLSNLEVGQQYQVQLFALDNRSGLTPVGSSRYVNWQDPADPTDTAETFAMNDNVYTLGTFTATNSTMTIQQNMLNVTPSGNFNCLVLRTVGWDPAPYWAYQPQNSFGYLGNSASVSGIAAGDATIPNPTITYQWQAGPVGGPYTNLVEGAKYAGTTSSTLTISNLNFADGIPVYLVVAANGAGSITSSVANVLVEARTLVGEWFNGSNSLADVSGYQTPGTHDGYDLANAGGSLSYTNDVPPGQTGMSLYLNNDGVAIHNSSTADAGYTNTFDAIINHTMTVAFWAKGWPSGGWNPWVSKYGENGVGWQLRRNGGNNPTWTIRGTGDNDDMQSSLNGNDSLWHYYAGTYNAATGVRNLYVDGVLSIQETNNGLYTLSANSHVCIGARDNAGSIGNYFTGNIYDVRIYDYDLNSNEVQALAAVPDPSLRGQPPQSITAFVGTTAQIPVTGVSGTAPFTYQWQFNGSNLVDNAQFFGSHSNVLSIFSVTTNNAGVYDLVIANAHGIMTVSSNVTVLVMPLVPPPGTNLVGQWLAGAPNFTDVSGYSPAGTHDGYQLTNGSSSWSSDLPFGAPPGGMSLSLNNSGIAISNSATTADEGGASTNLNANYTNTFDNAISTAFTVTFWAKGAPGAGSWNPWVSKYGENGLGWQYRIGTDAGRPCWTIRDGSSGTFVDGSMGPSWSRGGDQDDMHAAIVVANTSDWHFYVGTYDATLGVRKTYVDGVYAGGEVGNAQYSLAPGSHLVIGARDPGGDAFGNYFTGLIYDVRIYSTALSQAQVLYMTPIQPRKPTISSSVNTGGGSGVSSLVLSWSFGTLLEATNVAGPWNATTNTSPFTNKTTLSADFFKVSDP
jgi:hypothetical protein